MRAPPPEFASATLSADCRGVAGQEAWHDHDHVVVTPNRVFEPGRAAAIEIHVDSGPPSNVMYDGVVVHEWNEADQLVRYRL